MKLPLEGIRITDFSTVHAAPYGTMLLSFMGAEVIRIESKEGDITRQRNPGGFMEINLNKLSLGLDLKQPRGVGLSKELVKVSDIVVESFRPEVMQKLGLSYDILKNIKPDIIMLSLSGYGATGPESQHRTYAAIFASMGGLAHITGYPDGLPTEQRSPIDMRVGQFVAFAVMAALYCRRSTGIGQHIDLSARECMSSLIGEVIMDYILNGRNQSRKGNRDDSMAPHGCYRCKGDDRWVSIAVRTDDEWAALCKSINKPELYEDDRFSDGISRWDNQDELDRLIAEWTINYTDYEVMEILQRAGIAAVPSFDAEELYNDPHLRERGFISQIHHPEFGERQIFGPPWRLSDTPPKIYRTSPLLGQDNEYILGKLLSMSPEDIAVLRRDKVIY